METREKVEARDEAELGGVKTPVGVLGLDPGVGAVVLVPFWTSILSFWPAAQWRAMVQMKWYSPILLSVILAGPAFTREMGLLVVQAS